MDFNRNINYKQICITNRHLAEGDFILQIQQVLTGSGRPDMLVLREKDLPEEEYSKLAQKVMQVCHENNTVCILHYFKDTALKLGARGLHLPYQMFMELPGNEKNNFKIKGVSIHSKEEAVNAQRAGASYITAGHIYETSCKAGVKPRGTGFLREICSIASVPVYAVGGINKNNAIECIKAGASGVCMMSGYMKKQL
ncbi:MAG: thiamine phosphate synthase [Lachnospiraceae bacterium]|nr:thiamine phosphate synthase [Lachnospiraceae bacterium]